eukprot:1235293-Rhodomonas_salina.1
MCEPPGTTTTTTSTTVPLTGTTGITAALCLSYPGVSKYCQNHDDTQRPVGIGFSVYQLALDGDREASVP